MVTLAVYSMIINTLPLILLHSSATPTTTTCITKRWPLQHHTKKYLWSTYTCRCKLIKFNMVIEDKMQSFWGEAPDPDGESYSTSSWVGVVMPPPNTHSYCPPFEFH